MWAADKLPGATAGERYCRLVIQHAEATVFDEDARSAVLTRLDQELAEMVASGSCLPVAGSTN